MSDDLGRLITALRVDISMMKDSAAGQEVVIGCLADALEECANELEAWVEDHYKGAQEYPSEARRYRRDMEPVWEARNLLKRVR